MKYRLIYMFFHIYIYIYIYTVYIYISISYVQIQQELLRFHALVFQFIPQLVGGVLLGGLVASLCTSVGAGGMPWSPSMVYG